MERRKIYRISGLLILGIIISTGLAIAYRGDYSVKGPYYDEERHIAMHEAFENEDYYAWKALMTQDERYPRVVSLVKKDNFRLFAQAHEAAEKGDLTTASKIRAELGLRDGIGQKDGLGKSEGKGNHMNLGKAHRIRN